MIPDGMPSSCGLAFFLLVFTLVLPWEADSNVPRFAELDY